MRKTYIFCSSEFKCDDANYSVINSRETLNIINSNLVIIVDNNNKVDNYELFKIMYKVASKGNSVYLIGVNLDPDYAKNIYCLAVAKSIYNIYSVESMDIIDDEYLESILGKTNTLQDIENYIGSDVVFSETIGTILLEIINKCNEGDDAGLLEYIKCNVDILKNSVYYNDCMRSLNDKLANEVEKAKTEKDGILDEYDKIKKGAKDKDDRIKKLEDNLDNFKRDLITLKQENDTLVEQLNKSGPVVSSFQQIHTGTLAKCKTKSILYFKEVTYVRYVNSLIVNMMKMLTTGISGIKVRLLIFDNKNDFSAIYKPLNIVTLQDYLQNKDRLMNVESMVIVDPNHVIVEDMLKIDHDLLIIYDRLRLSKDIVHGNDVFKYWVINSKSNYEAVKSDIVDTKYVITRPGVFEDNCIAIPTIAEYKKVTESAKLYKYRALANDCKNPQGLIVDNILQRAGIKLSTRRR